MKKEFTIVLGCSAGLMFSSLAQEENGNQGVKNINNMTIKPLAMNKGANQAGRVFNKADTDADGVLSSTEFASVKKVAKMFGKLDVNNDGSLSPDELKGKKIEDADGDGTIGKKDFEQAKFKSGDTNGDNRLTLDEFKTIPGILSKGGKGGGMRVMKPIPAQADGDGDASKPGAAVKKVQKRQDNQEDTE